jgi:chromosome segregation ATPase
MDDDDFSEEVAKEIEGLKAQRDELRTQLGNKSMDLDSMYERLKVAEAEVERLSVDKMRARAKKAEEEVERLLTEKQELQIQLNKLRLKGR